LPGWDPAALSIVRLHEKITRMMTRQLKALCREHGLTEKGQTILALIEREYDRPAKLVEYMDVFPSTITFETDKLVAAGLMTRESVPGDRRVVLLKATPKGHAVNVESARLLSALFRPSIETFAPGELDQFLAIGRKILPPLESAPAPRQRAGSKAVTPAQSDAEPGVGKKPRRSRTKS
jgi:DNA-binding MarR family transcriptional regulator